MLFRPSIIVVFLTLIGSIHFLPAERILNSFSKEKDLKTFIPRKVEILSYDPRNAHKYEGPNRIHPMSFSSVSHLVRRQYQRDPAINLMSVDSRTHVGTFMGGGYGVNLNGEAVALNRPVSLSTDSTGEILYVTDSGGHGSVREIILATGVALPALGLSFTWEYPQCTVVSKNNDIYVTDSHRVSRLLAETRVGEQLAGRLKVPGRQDGVGTFVRFNEPFGLAIDSPNRYLYIGDSLNNAIRRMDLSANFAVTTVSTSIVGAKGLAMDHRNRFLYVTSNDAHSIYSLEIATRVVSLVAGSGVASEAGIGYIDGPLLQARFANPTGISIDHFDNLYVTDQLLIPDPLGAEANDTHMDSIRLLNLGLGNVTTIAGRVPCKITAELGVDGIIYSGCMNDGSGESASFLWPTGIFAAGNGSEIFIADSGNNRIRRISCEVGYNMTQGVCLLPTAQPTSQPSNRPSLLPSSQPSSQPTRRPTRQPTSQPSRMPTRQPTRQPVLKPSSQPSRQPSSHPSSTPSNQPTRLPSVEPSVQPSSRPVGVPSSQPTRQPRGKPSAQPSRSPSRQPTTQPTRQPSSQPSRQPTRQPSAQPSRQPSSLPSSLPTAIPSCLPSSLPTSIPQSEPTSMPSSMPSAQPVAFPTAVPTKKPTPSPSKKPSCRPTRGPTLLPTVAPSRAPTLRPSVKPTTLRPTQSPSTDQPSLLPTLSTLKPSGRPTESTYSPSSLPTDSTEKPSMVPTESTLNPTENKGIVCNSRVVRTSHSFKLISAAAAGETGGGELGGSSKSASSVGSISTSINKATSSSNMASLPSGVFIDPSNPRLMVVTDRGLNQVRVLDALSTATATASSSSTFLDAAGTFEWRRPSGVAMDLSGNMFVSDNHRVSMIPANNRSSLVVVLVGSSSSLGESDGRGPKRRKQAIDKKSRPGKDDSNRSRAGNGRSPKFPGGGEADGRLSYPMGLAVDRDSQFVYVADSGSNSIRRISITDSLNDVADEASSFLETVVSSPELNTPVSVAIAYSSAAPASSLSHTLYVSSFHGHAIFRLTISYSNYNQSASTATFPYFNFELPDISFSLNDNLFAGSADAMAGMVDTDTDSESNLLEARFTHPSGLALSIDETTLYIVDLFERKIGVDKDSSSGRGKADSSSDSGSVVVLHSIRKITLSASERPIVSTLAGGNLGCELAAKYAKGISSCSGDGFAAFAKFSNPSAVAVGQSSIGGEVLYIADTGNQAIRNISCSQLLAPKYSPPTVAPTILPSTKTSESPANVPSRLPTRLPSSLSISGHTKSPSLSSVQPKPGPKDGSDVDGKTSSKSVKTASVDTLLQTELSKLSAMATISILAVVFAVAVICLAYYRFRIVDWIQLRIFGMARSLADKDEPVASTEDGGSESDVSSQLNVALTCDVAENDLVDNQPPPQQVHHSFVANPYANAEELRVYNDLESGRRSVFAMINRSYKESAVPVVGISPSASFCLPSDQGRGIMDANDLTAQIELYQQQQQQQEHLCEISQNEVGLGCEQQSSVDQRWVQQDKQEYQ